MNRYIIKRAANDHRSIRRKIKDKSNTEYYALKLQKKNAESSSTWHSSSNLIDEGCKVTTISSMHKKIDGVRIDMS